LIYINFHFIFKVVYIAHRLKKLKEGIIHVPAVELLTYP